MMMQAKLQALAGFAIAKILPAFVGKIISLNSDFSFVLL
jgi:hypothetical protein